MEAHSVPKQHRLAILLFITGVLAEIPIGAGMYLLNGTSHPLPFYFLLVGTGPLLLLAASVSVIECCRTLRQVKYLDQP